MSKRMQQNHPAMQSAHLLTISQVAVWHCVHRTTARDFITNDSLPVLELGARSTPTNSIKRHCWMNERTGLSAREAQEGKEQCHAANNRENPA
jgi:hypothetical protein